MNGKAETSAHATERLFAVAIRAGFGVIGSHRYNDAGGAEFFRVTRLRHSNWPHLSDSERNHLRELYRCDSKGKIVLPIHRKGDSYVIGRPTRPPEGWPLYWPPYPLVETDRVTIVEGEACANDLAKIGITVVTSGSASSANSADWTSLRGRSACVWPDNDTAGANYAEAVKAKLRALGVPCDSVNIEPLGLPDGGDCVDYLADHPNATATDVMALTKLTASVVEILKPEPLPSPLPAVPVFNSALLPASVRAWCVDTAEGLQVPLEFTGIPAMVALAACTGRAVAIAMKQHDRWYEFSVLWAAIIGRPSSGKSPALNPSRRMLERVLSEERKAHESALRKHEERALIAEAARTNAKRAIQTALKKGDQLAAESHASGAFADDDPPGEPRIVVNDATIEKLGELLKANPRGLVQFRDELAGWLANLEREGREGDRAFWLECWNGTGPFTWDRIGRGTIHIEACFVSILGGMQPGKLAEYVRGAIRGGFSDDGLIQRFQLAVYPDLPASWTYTDRPADPESEKRAWETFRRLRALDPQAIGAERADGIEVPFLRFSDEAQGLFVEWQTGLMQRLRRGEEPAWMESHLAKYPSLVGRLALVLHLADEGKGCVEADTLATALDWGDYLEGHARRIYAPALDNGLTAAHLILKRRDALGDTFTARDIQRRCWAGLSDRETIGEALELLLEQRYLTETSFQTGGRPSVIYAWRSMG